MRDCFHRRSRGSPRQPRWRDSSMAHLRGAEINHRGTESTEIYLVSLCPLCLGGEFLRASQADTFSPGLLEAADSCRIIAPHRDTAEVRPLGAPRRDQPVADHARRTDVPSEARM